jgi:hypothetical protein
VKRSAVALCLLVLVGCTSARPHQSLSGSPVKDSSSPRQTTTHPPGMILIVQEHKLRLYAEGHVVDLATPSPIAAPGDATLAADGNYVAAVLRDDLKSRLWVHSLTEKSDRTTPLSDRPDADVDVAWAPDASYFAYVTGKTAVIVSNLNGEIDRITFNGEGVNTITWGPGHRLVIGTHREGSQTDHFWTWAPGSSAKLTAEDGKTQSLMNWSPDGGALAYVGILPGGSSALITTGSTKAILVKSEDLKATLPPDVVGSRSLDMVSPTWSRDGERIAAMAITREGSTAYQWFIVMAGLSREKPVVWTAPPHPCYVYGYWWGAQRNLLVQIAGPECAHMVVLNGETGQVVSEFPIPLKGKVLISNDRTWVAVQATVRPFTTDFIPLDQPQERLVVPITGLVGWCCNVRK